MSSKTGVYIVLYADDILLMAPSVHVADQLLKSVERELINLDMVINAKNSCCCLRISPRCNVACRPLSTSSGVEIPWKDKIRYLGAFVVQCRKFKCCLDDAKKSFYRAANAVLGKIGRIASEEVILEIIRCKCIPIVLYGNEAFMLNKSELSSPDFVINRLFMKLLRTILKRLHFVKISLDLISPVYYGRDVSVISTISSLRRKMPFVS